MHLQGYNLLFEGKQIDVGAIRYTIFFNKIYYLI